MKQFQSQDLSNHTCLRMTRRRVAISCVNGGECIFKATSTQDGAGTFIDIRGSRAQATLQGLTFMNAATSAVLLAKKAGSSTKDVVKAEDILESMFCECNFLGNQGHTGAAIRAHPVTRVHVESCTFSQNLALSGGGAIHNAAEEMSLVSNTFDDNSAQIGVVYTSPRSKVILLENTFLLGDNQQQYESAAIYVHVEDESNFVDGGGNSGYDTIDADSKTVSYCNGVYINNEDECIPFVNDLYTEDSRCTNAQGVFRNDAGELRRCQWLSSKTRRTTNCGGLTELGKMCPKACDECHVIDTSAGQSAKDNKEAQRLRRKRKKLKKKQQRQKQRNQASSLSYPTQRPTIRTNQPLEGEKNTNDIVFYVVGDAPYRVSELDPTDGFPNTIRNIPNDADFIIHVGDILSAKESECHLSWYKQVAFMLTQSNSPVFITPGDNDWLAWSQWMETFENFEMNWSPHVFDIVHQPSMAENVSFVHKGVLFVIVHLVSDPYDIESERELRHKSELAWVKYQIETHKGDIDAIVIVGHSPPSVLNRDFFSIREGGIAETIETLDIPVLYIHGSGHKFVEEEQFNSLDNFLRIQVPGRETPPLQVTIDQSKKFWFDFNDAITTTVCCEGGWPSRS
ncbi:predicted protein [Thalassiosira pseudonana CCMP1335]|uniref:Calcineurin-like phosphoesterase domain-containing protein n=1 Tax=Thalassiosira pseudonana TaxID=35128 RepID=B8BQY3_THAPS|nr:predicted protein [Thalassiosira pseudonana CCMP1335]EED95868.1 predicted protein [Thalassiosira pseudonana CCMP1335]